MSDGDLARSRAWAEIDRAALAHNIDLLQSHYGRAGRTRIMAVVKADAYGHDVSLIAPFCYAAGLRDFGIATVEEGRALRGLLPADAALYLLATALPSEAPAIVAHRLIALVSDNALGSALSEAALAGNSVAEAHLDVDTGIGRAGVGIGEALPLLHRLDALPGVRIMGVSTHFASADEDVADAQAQHDQFAAFVADLGPRADTLLLHAANSPASLALPGTRRYDLIRPGLLLYGIEPAPVMFSDYDLPLRPVLSVKARVLLVRSLHAGATISYGRTYTVPPGGGVYATIGIGYGDGWPRRLSNQGFVLLQGRRAPICGRICMDQLVVDVSHIPGVSSGDIATLLGTDGEDNITAGALAADIGTTPHEITTCLLPRLPRALTTVAASDT